MTFPLGLRTSTNIVTGLQLLFASLMEQHSGHENFSIALVAVPLLPACEAHSSEQRSHIM
jgi:hypothetical protein